MVLSRYTLKNIQEAAVQLPGEAIFELPEKVLQFGTGVLLRGLPDYFIDKANKQGLFNGRVVVVKSTSQGDASAFDKQDGLYTICVRGIAEGKAIEENIINAAISRVLNAQDHWQDILNCAHDPHMQVIISNTTEVGIQLVHDDIHKYPPVSFPGKLLAFLYERFKAFGGSANSGMVIIPTELIPDNGKKLESIVLELAHLNGLEEAFIEWLEQHNHFCSSLVDRIVPGRPDNEQTAALENDLGYQDQLLTMAEVYRLWAIEGDESIRNILSFAQADEGVVIAPNIEQYRELKLRLLNGTHTLSCGLAYLAGCTTVKEAMDNDLVATYIREVMLQELAPVIPYRIAAPVVQAFGQKVLDRFRNPHIRHLWLNITVQYTSKMKMRNIPLLLQHYQVHNQPPELVALGFAAYLTFMQPVHKRDNKYYGEWNGQEYAIQDDSAALFYHRWKNATNETRVKEVLQEVALWGEDLSNLPGFYQSVVDKVNTIEAKGMVAALEQRFSKNAFV